MKHIVPLMRYVVLATLALSGIALGGLIGALSGIALAFVAITPVAVCLTALFSSAHFDPMSVWFPFMENCATMGFAAGGVVSTFLISRRYGSMEESPL